MKQTEYWKKSYEMAVQDGNQKLFLSKRPDTDWSHISMLNNSNEVGQIELRSKEHAEALRFMLDQMLN